jgi:hypothetical protein
MSECRHKKHVGKQMGTREYLSRYHTLIAPMHAKHEKQRALVVPVGLSKCMPAFLCRLSCCNLLAARAILIPFGFGPMTYLDRRRPQIA